MTIKELKRDQRVFFGEIGQDKYQISDKEHNLIVDGDSDYYIYIKYVNFQKNGSFDGIYQGENPSAIIDDKVETAYYDETKGWLMTKGKKEIGIKTARLVAIKNKSNVIVVIQGS